MSKREQLTVKVILNMLEHCSPDALINIMINIDNDKIELPVVSMLIHESANKREIISFLSEKEDYDYDIQV